MKKVVGLTGGLGSGKSTVLALFRRLGTKTLDADAIVHTLLKRNPRVRKKVKQLFGTLDRKEIARAVFSSPAILRKLEGILHPAVAAAMSREMCRWNKGIIVCDVPLLYERGWDRRFKQTVVVTASRKNQLARLKKRGMTASEAAARMKAQWPLARKVKKADFVINNNGSKDRTAQQVKKIWKILKDGRK